MIIKQSRQGKDVSNMMKLLSYRGKAVLKKSQVSQSMSDPRIVNGRLLMRSQTIYVVSPNKAVRTLLLNRNLLKCPHNSRYSGNNVRTIRVLFERFEDHGHIGHRERISVCRCIECPTEFEVFLQYFEGQGVILFIIKWQDIGTGLEPLDNALRPVIGSRPPAFNFKYEKRKIKRVDYESPKDRFEGVTSDQNLLAAPATLIANERDELFRVYTSHGAQLSRLKKRFFWPVGEGTHMFPHLHPIQGRDADKCRCGRVCSCGLRWEWK
ncbi:hypothetical protein VTL71DRAFT_5971 [Oculimacula yallundae]|uniref:Uncharacterized protein n=1 Tax=Oculimacula yallundae TaxID=86028 RepID=A0ABR4C0Q1_9HELO